MSETLNLPVGFHDLNTPAEIEFRLVAALLTDAASVRRLAHIAPAMFSYAELGQLWGVMRRLVEEGRELSPAVIAAQISPAGELATGLSANGADFRQHLSDASALVLTDGELLGYAEVVSDRWKRRQAVRIGEDLHTALHDIDTGESADAVVARVSKRLIDLIAEGGSSEAVGVETLCAEIAKGEAPFATISTGYNLLDDAMGGGLISPGLTVFEARPKCFKTGTLGSLAFKLAQRGILSSFLTLEMPAKQIVLRLIAADDLTDVRNFAQYPDRMRRAANAFALKHAGLIQFHNLPNATFSAVQAALWRAVHAGAKVLLLDYFQLIRGCPHGVSKLDFLDDVAGWLQGFANQAGVALVVAAQVGRNGETYGSDALNRNASFVAQIREAEEHSTRAKHRRLWMDIRYARHGDAGDLGNADNGPFYIRDVGPVLGADGGRAK